ARGRRGRRAGPAAGCRAAEEGRDEDDRVRQEGRHEQENRREESRAGEEGRRRRFRQPRGRRQPGLSEVSRVHVHTAARVVRAGGVVAYPTEAVYGLGCVPTDERALARLIAIKRRDARKGFLLIAADLAQLEPFAELPGEPRRSEILARWPGPVTWVLAARRGVSALLTGGPRTIAVRVTAHPLAPA